MDEGARPSPRGERVETEITDYHRGARAAGQHRADSVSSRSAGGRRVVREGMVGKNRRGEQGEDEACGETQGAKPSEQRARPKQTEARGPWVVHEDW